MCCCCWANIMYAYMVRYLSALCLCSRSGEWARATVRTYTVSRASLSFNRQSYSRRSRACFICVFVFHPPRRAVWINTFSVKRCLWWCLYFRCDRRFGTLKVLEKFSTPRAIAFQTVAKKSNYQLFGGDTTRCMAQSHCKHMQKCEIITNTTCWCLVATTFVICGDCACRKIRVFSD